jgi:hypothetical protein
MHRSFLQDELFDPALLAFLFSFLDSECFEPPLPSETENCRVQLQYELFKDVRDFYDLKNGTPNPDHF